MEQDQEQEEQLEIADRPVAAGVEPEFFEEGSAVDQHVELIADF